MLLNNTRNLAFAELDGVFDLMRETGVFWDSVTGCLRALVIFLRNTS